jgi:cytoskeletal protein CcmA (bactofilin family)
MRYARTRSGAKLAFTWRMLGRKGLWKKRQSIMPDSVTAFIDESSHFEGKYSSSGTVMLNGRLKGEVESTGTLIIGGSAVVQARIRGRCVLVDGEVLGDIIASERIELRNGARVVGDVETPVLLVSEGAVFEGQTRMTKGVHSEVSVSRDLAIATPKP